MRAFDSHLSGVVQSEGLPARVEPVSIVLTVVVFDAGQHCPEGGDRCPV